MNTNPARRFRTAEERDAAFLTKVDRSGGPEACWPWTGYLMPNGYGQACVGQRHVYAHRRAFELATDAPPRGLVLHTCDNRKCCNPKHLYDGTQRQNMQDMADRGRGGDRRVVGEANGKAKLSDDEVAALRAAYRQGARQVDLAERFGISQTQVSRIVRGEQRK